jgi:hypothetical protein
MRQHMAAEQQMANQQAAMASAFQTPPPFYDQVGHHTA